jgi:hypothetical protein
MKNLENEIWKDVKGYEGLYKVSNLGRVKSLDRIVITKKNVLKTKKGQILNLTKKKNGYLSVMFSFESIKKRFYVHRLVALSFIENNKNKLTVNHVNGIKTDNRIENLEWNSYCENLNHAIQTGLRMTGSNSYNSRFTQEKVVAIRRLYVLNPNFNKLKLAKKLNVSDGLIHKIIKNKNYKGLEYQYSNISGKKKSEL